MSDEDDIPRSYRRSWEDRLLRESEERRGNYAKWVLHWVGVATCVALALVAVVMVFVGVLHTVQSDQEYCVSYFEGLKGTDNRWSEVLWETLTARQLHLNEAVRALRVFMNVTHT